MPKTKDSLNDWIKYNPIVKRLKKTLLTTAIVSALSWVAKGQIEDAEAPMFGWSGWDTKGILVSKTYWTVNEWNSKKTYLFKIYKDWSKKQTLIKSKDSIWNITYYRPNGTIKEISKKDWTTEQYDKNWNLTNIIDKDQAADGFDVNTDNTQIYLGDDSTLIFKTYDKTIKIPIKTNFQYPSYIIANIWGKEVASVAYLDWWELNIIYIKDGVVIHKNLGKIPIYYNQVNWYNNEFWLESKKNNSPDSIKSKPIVNLNFWDMPDWTPYIVVQDKDYDVHLFISTDGNVYMSVVKTWLPLVDQTFVKIETSSFTFETIQEMVAFYNGTEDNKNKLFSSTAFIIYNAYLKDLASKRSPKQ
jgi:hypothetical protein